MTTGNESLQLAWTQLWQVTAVAIVVAALVRMAARKRPHLAHVLWLVVLLKCVTPPLLTSPSGVFCWLQHKQADEVTAATLENGAEASTRKTPHVVVEALTQSAPVASELRIETRERSSSELDALLAAQPTKDGSGELTMLFTQGGLGAWFWCWVVGTLAIAAVTTIRWFRCLRSIYKSGVSRDRELEVVVSRLGRQLGLRRKARLLVTNGRLGPAVIGIFRPTLLLPRVIVAGKSPQELEPILAHELLHLRRGDLWVGLLQVLAQAIWWFHPLVWVVNRMLTREAERCCDEEVIAELRCDPRRYASCLIDILELKQTLQPVPVFPGVRPVEVTSQRLERIMKLGQGSLKRTPWWCWLAMIVAAAMMLPGGTFVVAAKEKGKSKKSASRFTEANYVERSYKLGDVVKTAVNDFDMDEDGAKQWLIQHLQSMCSGPWDKPNALTLDFRSAKDGKGTHIARQADRTSEDPPMRWSGKRLVVRHTRGGHERLQTAIATIREYGMHRIAFETEIITGPTELIRSLSSEWVVPKSVDHGTMFVRRLERPLPSAATEQQSTARVSVEKKLPIMLEVLSDSRRAQILATLEKHPRANTLQTPKVVLFNGQSASIQDLTQRPFVVGMRKGQPQIRVVSCGLDLQLRPILRNGENLWLDYELKHSEVRDVSTTQVKIKGKDKPVTLQVPEVVTARIDSAVELQLGKTLLVGGLKLEDREEDTSLLFLLRATRVDRGELADVARTDRLMFGAGVESNAGVTGTFTFEVPVRQAAATEQVDVSEEPPAALSASSEERLAGLVEEFNALMKEKRYSEAHSIAKRAAKSFPSSSVTKAMLHKSAVVREIERNGKERDGKYLPNPYYYSDDVTYYAPGPEFKLAAESAKPKKNDHVRVHRGLGAPDESRTQPTDEEVLTAIEENRSLKAGELTGLYERHRNNFHVVKEKIADYVDPPRFVPLIGVAQLHHTRFKCTVSFEETTKITWPVPHSTTDSHVEVVFVDVTRYQRVGREDVGLDGEIKLNLQRVPLRDAIAKVAEAAGMNMRIDERVLKAKGIRCDEPVTLQLQQAISARNALRLILSHHDLTYVVKDDLVTVTHVSQGATIMSYNVADLVLPIPGSKHSDVGDIKARLKDQRAAATADFDTLIDLITSTIEPHSWEKNNGPGGIQAYDTNLSIVVWQTQEVHEQIADLLEQLRRLQDVQVTLECRSIELAPDAYDEVAKKIDFDWDRPWVKLTDVETFFVLKCFQGRTDVSVHRGPKVTVFNGQGVQLPLPMNESKRPAGTYTPLQVVAVATGDRKSTRLTITPQTPNEDERETFTLSVGQGKTLLVDTDRLSGARKKVNKRTLLLITPQVIVVRESEEEFGSK